MVDVNSALRMDVDCVVYETARRKVLQTGRKRVHAFVVGEMVPFKREPFCRAALVTCEAVNGVSQMRAYQSTVGVRNVNRAIVVKMNKKLDPA